VSGLAEDDRTWIGLLIRLLGPLITLISFLVGFGVCLHAGAVFGRMWEERQIERAALDNEVAKSDDARP
jgi:hypothetical protein